MPSRDEYYFNFFPRAVPKKVTGGIKSQSKRGTFGQSWWAQRWIKVLESFNIGARLQRGRSYARNGQVISIDIDKGIVTAKVQGTRATPYKITIKVKTLSNTDWKKLGTSLSKQAIFAAKLLAGEMPQDIETAFSEVDLSLFPKKLNDLQTDCSCPDWSNPCKHIAAVFYLLGEEFDRDPFLIFKLRGIKREELIDLLNQNQSIKKKDKGDTASLEMVNNLQSQPEPLPTDLTAFWTGNEIPDSFFGNIDAPYVPAGLLKRLGNFPFWRGRDNFGDFFKQIYKQASQTGISIFLGEKDSGGRNHE